MIPPAGTPVDQRLYNEVCRKVMELEAKIYLPGHWECPKCKFYLVSTSINANTGDFAANQEPQQCSNECGPMWRVTHEQSANTMVDRCDALQDKVTKLEARDQWFALGYAFEFMSDNPGAEWTKLESAYKALPPPTESRDG